MTEEQAQQLRRSVRRLVRAEVAYSWKGSLTDRDDISIVEEELRAAKASFGVLLARLTTKDPS